MNVQYKIAFVYRVSVLKPSNGLKVHKWTKMISIFDQNKAGNDHLFFC